jgi:hypothetical protein
MLVEKQVGDEVGIEDLYDQVLTRIEIQNAVSGRRGSTARRIVAEIFELMRLRRRNGLPPYRESAIRGVVWLLVRNH